MLGLIRILRREDEIAAAHVDTTLALSKEHGFEQYLVNGLMLQGWLKLHLRADPGGKPMLLETLEIRKEGWEIFVPFHLYLLIQACRATGDLEQANHFVQEAWVSIKKSDQTTFAPEIHRLAALLLLDNRQSGTQAAMHELVHAIREAQKRQMKMLELRAATDLARLYLQDGKSSRAIVTIQPIYNWFTEGLDTADLKDAKALLKEFGQ
jgi:predicted ATPase